MIYVFLVVSCIVFVELFIFLDPKTDAAKIVKRSRESIGVVISSELDDDEKEAFMRNASIQMFKGTFILTIKWSSNGFPIFFFPEKRYQRRLPII